PSLAWDACGACARAGHPVTSKLAVPRALRAATRRCRLRIRNMAIRLHARKSKREVSFLSACTALRVRECAKHTAHATLKGVMSHTVATSGTFAAAFAFICPRASWRWLWRQTRAPERQNPGGAYRPRAPGIPLAPEGISGRPGWPRGAPR